MDYGSSWAEPHAAPPPVHRHHHLYHAPLPYLHHPDVIHHHQPTQPSSSTTAPYYYPNANPNPNHYNTSTHDFPLPSAVGTGALRSPVADPYAPRPHAAHGGYDGLHVVPYSYTGVVPPAGAAATAAGVGAPSAYYYGGGGEDPHRLAVKEAVRQYGVDPHSYGPKLTTERTIEVLGKKMDSINLKMDRTRVDDVKVLARSSDGWAPAAPPQIRPLYLHGSASHPTSEKTKKRRKKVTKIVQSAYCEVCKIECNTREVLKTHRQGKRHKKMLQKLQKSITANRSKAPKATVESKEIPDGAQSKAVGGKAKRKGAPASAEELEAKTRRVLEGGADAEGVKVCTICNVVVNSQKVFEYHVAGQKHASMVKKLQQGEVAAASAMVVE